MSRDEFVRILGPHEVTNLLLPSSVFPHPPTPKRTGTDLTTRIDLTQETTREGIPEPNLHIRRPSSTSQNPMLVRIPRNRLDRSDVFRKPVQWRVGHSIPYEQLVIVPSARELVLLYVPLESTDFLSMTRELRDVVRGNSDVAVVDESIVGSRTENVVVPGECTDARRVSTHRTDQSTLVRVPDLDTTRFRTNRELRSLYTSSVKQERERGREKGTLTFSTQLILVIESVPPFSLRSHSFVTALVWALQRYTQAPSPTPRTLVEDQSTRLR